MCEGVPCATGPICSADGEGGGEGGKLAESSTAKGERERERERQTTTGRQDMDGRKEMKTNNSADLISVGGHGLPLSLEKWLDLCVCVCV